MDTATLTPISANAVAAAQGSTPAADPNSAAARWAALPARSKLAAVAGVLVLVGLVAFMGMNARQGDWRILYANLAERDGGAIVEKLGQMNVPYRFADGSGTLMVPAERVHEVRMKLSSAGLPKGSIDGYELLDKTPFGQTQGQERMAHKRAIEGELTRTIQSLAAVQSAKVMLALPQMNGFFREQTKPSASVVINLNPGRSLDAPQIAGIVHLVASSVPELATKAVSVVDGTGALLSQQPDHNAQGLDAQQVQYLRDTENTLSKRVLQLVEPVLGRENVRATVTAEIDFSQTESTAEEYKPNQGEAPATVRAQSVVEQQGNTAAPGAVAGAQSNQPQAAPSAPINGAKQDVRAAQPPSGGPGGAGSSRREQETRFEVDKKVSVTRGATGSVKRLNAAVVVNHRSTTDAKGKTSSVPLTEEELKKLTELVEQGIGFNKERGDSVRVINAPFHVDAVPKAEPLPMWKEPWVQELVRSGAMPAALALVALVLVFGLIRPALKPLFAPPAPPPEEAGGSKVSEVIDGDAELPGLEGSAETAKLPPPNTAKLDAVREMARQNPAGVAQVLRGWANPDAA